MTKKYGVTVNITYQAVMTMTCRDQAVMAVALVDTQTCGCRGGHFNAMRTLQRGFRQNSNGCCS